MLKRLIGGSSKLVPYRFQLRLKQWGLYKLLFLFYRKRDAELEFQRQWATEFSQQRDRVLEYWRRYRHLEEIISQCQLSAASRVLDVGCGISTVLHFVPGERIGIDPLADEYVKLYAYPTDISILKASGEAIPFPAQNFDVVFCSNVLDHVTDPGQTLDEIARMLKPNGQFVLTVEIFPQAPHWNIPTFHQGQSSKVEHPDVFHLGTAGQAPLRDPAHPHSLTRAQVMDLLQDKFETETGWEAPWIGLRAYVHGVRAGTHQEMICVAHKTQAAIT